MEEDMMETEILHLPTDETGDRNPDGSKKEDKIKNVRGELLEG